MNKPHKKGDKVTQRYDVLGYLAEGGMQYVFLALDNVLKRKVVIKTPKNHSADKRFKRSARVAAKVNHPNVARTYDYFIFQDRAYLIEELIDGQDLSKCIFSRVECLDPNLVCNLFHKIVKGLAASHHAGVIHRDLKPTNIMIAGGFLLESVKITDFGVAKLAESELDLDFGDQNSISASATAIGALPYMAPEAIDDEQQVDLKTDVWSIGAMMFELLTGIKPFGSSYMAVNNIIEGNIKEVPPELGTNRQLKPLMDDLMLIIKDCLNVEISKRPSADQLVERFSALCYSTKDRLEGVYYKDTSQWFGFIKLDNEDIFFHKDSYYGKNNLSIGDSVLFAKYNGGGADRAHPVTKLTS